MIVELFCEHVDKKYLWCQRQINLSTMNLKDKNNKRPYIRAYLCKECYDDRITKLTEVICQGLDDSYTKYYLAQKEMLLEDISKKKRKLEEIEEKIRMIN